MLSKLIALLHDSTPTMIPEPPIARLFFSDTRMAWLWLVIRVYLGWVWLTEGGLRKLGDPRWTGDQAGVVIQGFVKSALEKTDGKFADVPAWYATFLQDLVQPYPAFWAYLITGAEILVGLGLICGALTGFAAFFAGFMNLSYLLGSAVSWNPTMFVLATWLVLAWRTAGWYGLDRWLLPLLGVPWGTAETESRDTPRSETPAPRVASVAG